MRIATWNVNSIRARLERVTHWLEEHRPDVLCLQETKCRDEQFPREPLEDLGYSVEIYGQRTYNGVAILSLSGMEDVVRGVPGVDEEVVGRRVMGATVGDVMILDVYAVNGERVGSPKFEVKLDWYERLAALIAERYDMGEKIVVCGDFNCTFDDRDVYDADRWREKILCSTREREALARVMAPGLVDAFRRFHEESGHYTWWDYRTRGYQRGEGLRIDHFLMSEPALAACVDVHIDARARGGEKPSDHAPVIATFG